MENKISVNSSFGESSLCTAHSVGMTLKRCNLTVLQGVLKVRSHILFAYISVISITTLGKLSMFFLIDFTSNNLNICNQNGLLYF